PLLGPQLRFADDVRPPQRRRTHYGRAARSLRGLPDFVSDAAHQFSYRPVAESSAAFAGNFCPHKLLGQDHLRGLIRVLEWLRFLPADPAGGRTRLAGPAHAFFHTNHVVRSAQRSGSWLRLAPAQTLYSAGMLAVMHSAQYLWVTSY